MNFWDLCVACAHAIGRACKAVGHWIAELLRLTYRLWWIVLPMIMLFVAAACYYSRTDNLKYNVRTVVLLNGPSIQQFNQRFAGLQTAQTLPDDAAIKQHILGFKVGDFQSFRVVDVHRDSVADYIDFKQKSSPKDTIEVQMQDRVCVQFSMKNRNLGMLPQIEQEIMAYLNGDESMQRSYKAYYENLQREVKFNHEQREKLDSLTAQYYFHSNPGSAPLNHVQEGLLMVGDWRVHLFLGEIYGQQVRTERMDYRAELATAPVSLENHFAVSPAPSNPWTRTVPMALMIGWLFGCALAALIEQRKRIIAWLKQ